MCSQNISLEQQVGSALPIVLLTDGAHVSKGILFFFALRKSTSCRADSQGIRQPRRGTSYGLDLQLPER